MPRIDTDELSDPERIFIAWSLRVAKQVEQVLDLQGVSYAVEVEPLGRSFLFGSARHAAVFYVASGTAAYCRSQLVGAGLRKGVVDDGVEAEDDVGPGT